MKRHHELPIPLLSSISDLEVNEYERGAGHNPNYAALTLSRLTQVNPRLALRALAIARSRAASTGQLSPEIEFMAGVTFMYDVLRRHYGRKLFETEVETALQRDGRVSNSATAAPTSGDGA